MSAASPLSPAIVIGAIGLIAGVLGLVIATCLGQRPIAPDGQGSGGVVSGQVMAPSAKARIDEASRRRRLGISVGALGAALVTAALTRWPVAAALAGAAGGGLPIMLRSLSTKGGTERIEAVAGWTELLRDTLAAAAGLGQAIVATAELAPRPIRAHVLKLADRLVSGMPMEDALRSFASELDDASADLVVCALLVAATARSQRLADLLGALAESCRDQVALRLRIEASRASARSSVRTVVLISVAFAALLFVFAHSYLAPFGTPTGQTVLLAIGGCYAAGLVLMVRLVRPRPAVRLLGGGDGR